MNPQDLMKPRYKVIAIDTSGDFNLNDIFINPENWEERYWWNAVTKRTIISPENYPHLFKALQWWEHRTIEELQAVKFVKVITYRGYWRVGDIVKAKLYLGSIEKARPTGFELEYNHYQPIFELEPSTESEYLQSKEAIKQIK